jgi:hypothetical protein
VAVVLPVSPQESKRAPLQKSALLTAIRTGRLQPVELVAIINRRGLAFPMGGAAEQELRAAGASDLVIDAMWAKENFEIKPGPPVTQEVIIESLQAGVPPKRLERMVRIRSANVALSRDVADKIKSAGGTDELLGTILANASAPPPVLGDSNPVKPVEPAKPGPQKRYDELIGQARELVKSGNHGRAADLVKEAENVDSQRWEAYDIGGQIFIESLGGVVQASTEYSKSIERNGEISVPMLHLLGHNKGTFRPKTSNGIMTISRTSVKYISIDDPAFTIETGSIKIETASIKQVDVNSSKIALSARGSGFHIIWTDTPLHQREESFRVNVKDNQTEAGHLIVELIRKCVAH